MAITRIRHRGEPPRDVDLGPASGAGASAAIGAHAEVARLSAYAPSKLTGVGEPLTGGAGAVERRQATEAQREAWRAADVSEERPRRPRSTPACPHGIYGGLRCYICDPVVPTEPSPPEESSTVPEPTPMIRPELVFDAELVMPCERCAHEPVCAIRMSIKPGQVQVQIITVPLDEALTLQPPKVVIDCRHFLDATSVVFNREAARQLVPKGDAEDARAILDRVVKRVDDQPPAAGGGSGVRARNGQAQGGPQRPAEARPRREHRAPRRPEGGGGRARADGEQRRGAARVHRQEGPPADRPDPAVAGAVREVLGRLT